MSVRTLRLPSPTHPRRALGAAAATAAVALAAVTLLPTGQAGAAGTTLRSLAEANGLYFGTAISQGDLNNAPLTAVAGSQFGMLTPTNEMKWDTIEPSRGSFSYGPADRLVSFAQTHSMRVRGHTLVWHSQLPSWVNSLPGSQVKTAMENHINNEVTHYKGKLYAWDVVNEPFNEDGSFRTDAFYNAMGSGYVADALRTARAADPTAKLYLNDYNIEGLNAKSDAMYNLVKSLKGQGVPLDGVGFQAHFILGQIPSSFKANLQRFTALGVNVAITELDDRMPLPPSADKLARQAGDYASVVNTCLTVSGCVGLTQWGVGDPDSWIPGTFPGYGAATLYDANYQPKPAYTASANALGGGTTSPTPTPTPTPTPPGASCQVSGKVSPWNTGLTEDITITNTGSTALNGWALTYTLPAGQTVTNSWNASLTPATGRVTATNLSYNATLAPGAATSFGFQATHTGDTAFPTSFSLNGTACTTS
ncbi:endo-1,4-beta-xylanase [Streptomyces sp. TLI_146]|uniref:endo-1,4-beta-xylanase n=1 Tax=Streptomyces sp. TLI_146 TaxID=1938858 RepID=UPI000CAA6BF2|nr:endo-1,4-beta-xylanase [Streptomyces sp. TLI_146]PKV82957.1 endo-1,4-beta-xylanase (glycosyl hydrolase family 10) [Streptomyces sp. TLI_146]